MILRVKGVRDMRMEGGEAKSAEGLREKTRKGKVGCRRRGSKPPEPPKAIEKIIIASPSQCAINSLNLYSR